MTTLLDVSALPRGDRSRTERLRQAFLGGFREVNPGAREVHLDLAREHDALPSLDAWDIAAKFEVMFGDGDLDETQAARWDAITRLTDQLHQADVVLVSAPMWNFTIPWMLKRWIDCVVQARLTFDYVDGGLKGLLEGRQAVILTTRDGDYRPGSPMAALDFHLPYLKSILGMIGLGPIHTVVAEPLLGPDGRMNDAALVEAIERARGVGRGVSNGTGSTLRSA